MSVDKYVIVFANGWVGNPCDRKMSDNILADFARAAFQYPDYHPYYRPTYRIRIKEKSNG